MVDVTQAVAVLPGGLPGSAKAAAARPVWARAILAFVAACAIAKLFAAWATGFTGDEAYTVVIARTLALSYFDHPPLHQWIVHAFAALTGEGWWLRLPFLLMALGVNLPLYGLTRRLFGPEAALWALFGFNAAIYFVVWPDGLILPDVPLFLFISTAIWAVAEILFGPARSQAGLAALWLAAGLAFGLAGLAKYSAAFAPMGLFGFLVFSRQHRHWLWRPYPYLGAALALAIFSPALIWNHQHDWVSFAFQSGRTAGGAAFGPSAFRHFAEAFGAQVALLSPWIGAPLVLALIAALRGSEAGSASRFLLWLAGLPLLLFSVMPFLGTAAIPHWFNSAWLFAFPLLGHRLSGETAKRLHRWATASVALAALTFAAFVAYAAQGPFWLAANKKAGFRDATEWSYNWQGFKQSPAWSASGAEPPAFAAVNNWRVGGKAGGALGPGVPVCAFTGDPRGFAFACDMRAFLGQDALIAIPKENVEYSLPAIAAYFERLGPSYEVSEGRAGRAERIVTLTRGYKLLRPYAAPYGINHIPARQ